MTGIHPTDLQLAARIIETVRAAGVTEDDPDFAEIVAAETDVPEMLRRVIRRARLDRAMAEAAGGLVAQMRGRQQQLEERAERLLRQVQTAMEAIGLSRLDAPDFVASIRKGPPAVVIHDEQALPQTCWITTHKPDKLAIRERLKAGEAVPGASLSNAEPYLAIRG